MVIGIEAERANNPVKTGVEHYAKQLILHLAKIDPVNSYILYLRTKPEEWLLKLPKNFSLKVMPFPIFWTQMRLSFEMLLHPPDVLFIPASALPLLHPKKSVVVVHDLAWRYFPNSFTWFMKNFLEWSTGFASKRASSIIAVSQSTKRDLVKFFKINEAKVKVIYHGYEEDLNTPPAEQKQSVDLPENYILFLSTLQPRKNLEGLIDAFVFLKKENPALPHKLVVVGKPGWKFENILKKIGENKEHVVYLNHVLDSERLRILAKAQVLVLPSFYEGFGMQILESFAASVPIALSNVSSLPEVAGDAAIYFDPHQKTEIKNAIKMLLTDKSLSESLKQKGQERLKFFSWEKCARQTLKLLTNIND